MTDHYDEYLDRVRWEPSEKLHDWVTSRIVREFSKHWSIQGKSILEIGTGSGRLANALQNIGVLYTGIEPNSKLAKFSRSLGYEILEQELPNLSKNFQNKFDATISIHVLEHAPTYLDARRWLEEMVRVTKPGGYILVATPDIRDYGSYFYDSDWSHGYQTTPARLTQLCNDLKTKVKFSGSMHLGSTSALAALIAHFISFIIPTRLANFVTMRLVKRPLASGIKIALLWGLTIVVAQKPEDSI